MQNSNNYFLSETAIKDFYKELLGIHEEENKEEKFDKSDKELGEESSKEELEWEIFILINRKGYWDYKIFFPDGVKLKDGQKIYSDRYIEKCPLDILKEELSGKRIRIYDDSITHGSNLFYFYLLCKSTDAKEVKPYVYACNTSFPSDTAINLMRREAERIKDDSFWEKVEIDKEYLNNDSLQLKEKKINSVIKKFIEDLTYKILLGNNDIERFSTWQTKLFQKYVSPLVMDLPMMNRQKDEDTRKRKIACVVLNKEGYKKLCAVKTENWAFVENVVHTDDSFVTASYFRFYKKELWDAFPYLAHDFIVKCKYKKVEDGDKVRVVFTPFAIVKSISYEKIWEAFDLLYHDTEYAKQIKVNDETAENLIKRMEDDANLCKGLFRAIIFRISHYIGLKFQELVKKEIGIQLQFDWNIMHDNFCKPFIDTEKEWESGFKEIEFLSTIARYKDEKIYISKTQEYSLRDKQKATQERISNQMRGSIIKKKKSATLDANDKKILEKRIYHFEDMENELDDRFIFQSKEDKQKMITNSCTAGLETNSISNYLLAKKEDHVLYRGFRYGENSEVFLHESLWFFYIFLYAYYETCPDNMLVKGYDEYMRKLRNYLEKKNYMNVWISEDGFEFLRKYFGRFQKDEEFITEIRRRRYLLEENDTMKRNQIKELFIREASSAIV